MAAKQLFYKLTEKVIEEKVIEEVDFALGLSKQGMLTDEKVKVFKIHYIKIDNCNFKLKCS